jgi:hypothetical protein
MDAGYREQDVDAFHEAQTRFFAAVVDATGNLLAVYQGPPPPSTASCWSPAELPPLPPSAARGPVWAHVPHRPRCVLNGGGAVGARDPGRPRVRADAT